MASESLLTVSDIAGRLQLAERTVLRMIHKGEIPCLRVASQWRFIPEQIEAWLREQVTSRVDDTDGGSGDGLTSLLEVDPDVVPVSRLTEPRLIVPDLAPGDRPGVLSQLVRPLSEAGIIANPDDYLAKLLDREEMISTAIGNGVAIPHIRNPRENPPGTPFIVIGICRGGTLFHSADGELTHLFFLVAARSDVSHLRLVARLNQFLVKPGIIAGLRGAESTRDVMEILMQEDTIYSNGPKERRAK